MLRDFSDQAPMHPLLFEISLGSFGAVRVPAFGAFLAVALWVGFALTVRLAGRAGLAQGSVVAASLNALFVGVLGARLGFVLLHRAELGSLGEAFSLRSGGLSGTVGLALGALMLAWEAHRRGLPPTTLCDAAAPALAAAVALTRIGCWLEGCDYGTVLSRSAPASERFRAARPPGSTRSSLERSRRARRRPSPSIRASCTRARSRWCCSAWSSWRADGSVLRERRPSLRFLGISRCACWLT